MPGADPAEAPIEPAQPRTAAPSFGAGPWTPRCRRLLRATDFVLAVWLLYLAYAVLHDVSAETAHWAVPEGLAGILLAVWVLGRPMPAAVRLDPLSIAAVVVSNWHYLLYDFAAESPGRTIASALLVAAVYVGVWARLTLGRSFAMLPALRDVRTGGPYQFVRHPIYLALVLTDIGLLLSHPSARNAALAVAGGIAHVVRVFREEGLLRKLAAYRAYTRRTRFRLLPGVF